jgi:hypothetical protein
MKERAETKMTARVWDRAPIAHWDRYLDDREPHLFSVAVTGSDPQAITRLSGFHLSRTAYSASSYDISPDGTEIALVADTDKLGTAPNYDLITIASCGCKPARNLTEGNAGDDRSPAYSPDGQWLGYTAQSIPGFYADRARLLLIDRTGGATRDLSGSFDRSVGDLLWRADSKALFSAIDDAATNRIYRFDLAAPGKPRAITTTPSFSGLAIARDAGARSAAVALRQSFSEPPTLVRLGLTDGVATRLTDFNDAALADVPLGKVESVTYAGSGGAPIQMWVVHPPDFDPAKRYPVFMLLHGGPHKCSRAGGTSSLGTTSTARADSARRSPIRSIRTASHSPTRTRSPRHSGSLRNRMSMPRAWSRVAAATAGSSPRRCSAVHIRSRP